MKKKLNYLLFIPIFSIVLIFGNTSCKDETDCKMEILVKNFSDTTVVVPYAKIHIHQNDIDIRGNANASGIYEHTFALEAIVNVEAKDSIITDTTVTPPAYILLIGEASIRLKPGETVKKTIFVK